MSGLRLSDAQRLDWLQLIRCGNIGPRTFRVLVNKFGSARAALDELPKLVRDSQTAAAIKMMPRADVEREVAVAQARGIVFVAMGEPDYPPALKEIDSCPPVIAVLGSVSVLRGAAVALVGSRNASAAGLAFAGRLARELGRDGLVVVSGLARGIDAAAHQAALRSGTIAVLAGGHARIYPAEHEPLVDEIVRSGGAVISEMPLEWEPRGRDFPRRNRLVSGLSQAVVVVEAARKSGSLITAKFALEQGREVFAVPGSPLDPRAEGTNDLLRQGATLCTRSQDVTEALHTAQRVRKSEPDLFGEGDGADQEPLWDEVDPFGQAHIDVPKSMQGQELDEPPPAALHLAVPARDPVVAPVTSGGQGCVPLPSPGIADLLGPAPVSIDDLVRVTGRPASEILQEVFEAELAGTLQRHGNGLVTLK